MKEGMIAGRLWDPKVDNVNEHFVDELLARFRSLFEDATKEGIIQ